MGFACSFIIEGVEDSIDSSLPLDFRRVPRQRSRLFSYQRGLLLQKRLDFRFLPRFSLQLNKQLCEVLGLRLKCRIEFRRGNVIQVIAHRLESDSDQNLKYLVLSVPGGEKVIHDLRAHMSAFTDDLLSEGDKRL